MFPIVCRSIIFFWGVVVIFLGMSSSKRKMMSTEEKEEEEENISKTQPDELLALVTGCTGQDGSYLCEILLEKKYHIWGMIRASSSFHTERLENLRLHPKLHLTYGSMGDYASIEKIFMEISAMFPNYKRLLVFHLAAQSHVKISFDLPIETAMTNAIGTANLLHCIHRMNLIPRVRFYHAATSELYGEILENVQDELTPQNPISPYSIAKQMGFNLVKLYRQAYNMFACNGILFNHESERRGYNFVTRKVTLHVGAVVKEINNFIGKTHQATTEPWPKLPCVTMGNIDSLRDWGFSRDYVMGMLLMLEHDTPDDYVLSTDVNYSVRHFIETAFSKRNLKIRWEGEGVNEKGYLVESVSEEFPKGQVVVDISEKYFRPADVNVLLGCSKKARTVLGWKPELNLDQLIERMLHFDCPNYPDIYGLIYD